MSTRPSSPSFHQLAHRWWDLEGEFRPLHQINPLRLDWINSLVPLEGQPGAWISAAAAASLADAMARKGAQVLGVDLATKSLRVAQLHA
jgi:2-polyprenyl-6-hydroxyphenyl methylase/3-demethylubiquinone-9 3-methyltransferase